MCIHKRLKYYELSKESVMNPVTYSIERLIKFGIPKPILNMTFLSRLARDHYTLDTLESRIREEVIQPRIFVDCNLVHGTQMDIPLAKCEKIMGNYYTTTWRIPKTLTQGKRITSVLEVTSAAGSMISADAGMSNTSGGVYTSTMTGHSTIGAVAAAGRQMQRSVMPIQVVSNALCYLVGDNTVLIKDSVMVPATMMLRVLVENDDNFNHIQPAWYPTFYELVAIAVKSYIYNNLTIEQDNVFIMSGGELNKFKEIVDSYADMEEIYSEKLEEWYKTALLNDPEASRQHYQMISGACF